MGILQRMGSAIFGEKRASVAGSIQPGDGRLAEAWGSGTGSGYFVTPDSAMRVTAVYACVKLLSNALAGLPWQIFRRGATAADRQIAFEHPLYPLVHSRPNSWQTPFQFRQMLQAHLLLRGKAFAEIVATGGTGVAELWPLHPDRVRPFRAPDKSICFDYQPLTGPRRIILQDEMFYLADLTLEDGFTGVSAIRLHRETVGAAMAAADYGNRFFGNSAQPDGAIEVPAVLTDVARKALIDGWENRHRGGDKAHRIGVLDGGMKWQQIGLTNEDAQYLETMRFHKGDIASIFGVPPYLIGEHEKTSSWGTGLEQLNISFLTYSLAPWLVIWEQSGERDLLTDADRLRYFLEMNVDGLLRGDFKTRMDGYAVGIQWGIYTINEVRAKENLPAVEGGNMRLQPLNMAPADKALDILLKGANQQQARAICSRVRGMLNGSASPELLAALVAIESGTVWPGTII